MEAVKKQFGKKTVYAVTPEAAKALEDGWQPCDEKIGCACGTKPAVAAKPEAAKEDNK